MPNETAFSPVLSEPRKLAAFAAHNQALRKGMTWRHALQDALKAFEAAAAGQSWTCDNQRCGACYRPEPRLMMCEAVD
jgi:hypothetical protein